MEQKALLFSIEEFSVFDGPGIRSSVFLKGCPLRCRWCHNPEGQEFFSQTLYKPTGKEQCGKLYSSSELCEKLLKNSRFYDKNGGGVTFSGGEPLSFTPFISQCMKKMKGKIHIAVQTSGFGRAEDFTKILALSNYILYDLKIMNNADFKFWCGRDNEIILNNYQTLAKSGVEFITRVPLIPTVTDTEENLTAIAEFMAKRGVNKVELLPYNRLAGAKYAFLDRRYNPAFDEQKAVNSGKEIFEKFGVESKVL